MPILHAVEPHAAAIPEFDNNLTIQHVGTGGNAGSGAYRFSYDTDSVLAPGGGHMKVNLLDADTPGSNSRYFVYSYTTTSPRIQAPNLPPSNTSTTIAFNLKLNAHELAFLAVVVWDKNNNALFSCDPQVGNDPETGPA
ncbi:MAG: hypothetical protein M3Q42_04740 [Pseudomonadota bacterium]|nr:hypothetical protein [Pseudomonadota bacterium]